MTNSCPLFTRIFTDALSFPSHRGLAGHDAPSHNWLCVSLANRSARRYCSPTTTVDGNRPCGIPNWHSGPGHISTSLLPPAWTRPTSANLFTGPTRRLARRDTCCTLAWSRLRSSSAKSSRIPISAGARCAWFRCLGQSPLKGCGHSRSRTTAREKKRTTLHWSPVTNAAGSVLTPARHGRHETAVNPVGPPTRRLIIFPAPSFSPDPVRGVSAPAHWPTPTITPLDLVLVLPIN